MPVTSLHTYPVKGCRRLDHDAAGVEPWGLAGDRRWMVVDPGGTGITQRDEARLTRLRAVPADGGVTLRAPGLPDRTVTAGGPETTVRVFSSKPAVPARVADDGGWLEHLLGRPARLVWLGDPTVRPVASHGRPGDRVSFADGHPVLLTSVASLAALGDWLLEAGGEPVPMTRFRPNIVVDGAAPWAEDDWLGGRLRIGDTLFRVAGACTRCVVTTIDQDTGETGREPLHTLGRHRRDATGLLFGINLIPDVHPGQHSVIRVGDAVFAQP